MALGVLCGGLGWAAPLASPESCAVLRKHGQKVEATTCYEALVRSGSAYLRAEGYWGLEQYTEANEQFQIATSASASEKDSPGGGALVRVRYGMLLHERFNNGDAVDLFKEALQRDPNNARAYLGLAVVSVDGFDNKAGEYALKALTLDPKLVEAHELLAGLALENGDTPQALVQADAALAVAPDALDAMAIHAAVELLADRSPDVWFGKIRAVNPGYGQGYALVARQLEMHYRYEDGIVYYRKAIEADPRLWSAHSALGIDLMRMGQEDEPRQQLEMSYNNGYRDGATVNSLRLLDSYKNFVTFKDETTILRMRKEEAELLQPYFSAELHRAMTTYAAKYKMTLPGPVQLEVYPDHEDFAVRTMGMPGLGALGVTFGEVVAMDSPSGRKPGEFNWDATLWHEMSHVYILTATKHRVPRWFTEGLAVHEEGVASGRPEWADRLTPEVVAAIRDKKLLPVAKLDRGFVMPDYPAQVVVSYFQAGSICDFIGSKWGEAKLLEMVHSFAEVKTTPEVLQADLRLSPEVFDQQYMAWLDGRAGKTAANFDAWRTQLKALVELEKLKSYDLVLKQGEAVRALYPEYVGEANAYEFLAEAHLAKGDKKAAADVLTAYERMGGQSPATLKELAKLQEELGQVKEAAGTLDRLNSIYPVRDEELHRHLGELWFAQGNFAGAIRENSAVVAMKPLDKAGAEFQLARAYFAAGERAKAEETVLLALEATPGFRPAQKLLLEIEHPESAADSKDKK
nr:tetratricopeptide repeat protein [Granulicella sp. dw_53]